MTSVITNIFSYLIQSIVNTHFFLIVSKKVYKNYENKHNTYKQRIIFFICIIFSTSLLSTIYNLNIQILLPFRGVLMIALTTLICKFTLDIKLGLSIILSILSAIFSAIIEMFSTIFCTAILRMDVNFLLTTSIGKLSIMSVYGIFSMLLILLIHKKLKNLKLDSFTNKLSLKNLVIFTISLVFYVFPQMFLFVSNKYEYPIAFLILNMIQFLLINVFLLIYLNKELKYQKYKSDLFTSEVHNKALIGMIDGVRTLKHDYNNIIQSLNGYVLTKQYDKLEEYVNSLLNECNSINNIANLDQNIFNDPAIYGVVGSKYFLATEKNIKFDFDISIDISSICFSMPDLSRILGIILDNAIEATLKTNKKYIRLQMSYDTRKNADVIKVFNTYDNSIQIDLNEIYKKGVSSKKIKSGIGLWEVKKLISKSNNSQIYATIEKNKFVQNIIIEKTDVKNKK